MSTAIDILQRVDEETGYIISYKEVTNYYDGSPMTDLKLDHVIFRKKDGKYYQRTFDNLDSKNLIKKTMEEFRNISETEILLLKMGIYEGVELQGYYVQGDTPKPVLYKISNTPDNDNGGNVIEISDVKFEHYFDVDVDLRYFGAKAGVNEDATQVLQKVINIYQESGKNITMGGKDIKISDQITIKYAPKISNIRIWFENSEVDSNGDALKHLFLFDSTDYGTLSGINLEKLKIFFTGTPPKNQHVIKLYGEGLVHWFMNDIYAEYYSGSLLYLQGTGSIYHPEFYQIQWSNILMVQGGGFIGQSNNLTDTWVVGGTIENIDMEHGIRQISPQPIIMNLKGFRNVTLNNLTFQGDSAAGVSEIIFTDKDVTLNNVWMEFVNSKPPVYWHNKGGISSGKNVFGITTNCKIKSTGKLSILKLNDIFLYEDANACFQSVMGGKIEIDGVKIESFSENQDFSNKRPYSELTRIGNVKFKNISTSSGGGYSVDEKSLIFKWKPGTLIKTNQEFQLAENVFFGSDNLIITTKDMGQEGRALSLKTGSGQGFPNGYFLINRLSRFQNSSMTVAIRMQVNNSNTLGNVFWTPALRNDKQGVVLDNDGNAIVDYVNGYRKFNQVYTCYLTISELTTSNLYIYLAPQSNDLTGDCEVLIYDVEILLGDKLPILKGSNYKNRELEFDSVPTTGFWIKGDIIYNSNVSSGNPLYWVCTQTGEFGISDPIFQAINILP